MRMTNANVHALQVHHETYVSQIKDALNVNGGDIENATGMDYVLHFLTFGWKVLSLTSTVSVFLLSERCDL